MALKIVGSNPTTHPTEKKDFHKKSFFFILGCSQVVRHHTLTVAFRWFESIQPNQTKGTRKGAFCLAGADFRRKSAVCGRDSRFAQMWQKPAVLASVPSLTAGELSGEQKCSKHPQIPSRRAAAGFFHKGFCLLCGEENLLSLRTGRNTSAKHTTIRRLL